ncbi:hypothetical protein L9F63_006046, partial [Diploptera punctata]
GTFKNIFGLLAVVLRLVVPQRFVGHPASSRVVLRLAILREREREHGSFLNAADSLKTAPGREVLHSYNVTVDRLDILPVPVRAAEFAWHRRVSLRTSPTSHVDHLELDAAAAAQEINSTTIGNAEDESGGSFLKQCIGITESINGQFAPGTNWYTFLDKLKSSSMLEFLSGNRVFTYFNKA